jgi:NAD(P)-dependent dehydrogenase (short-subunit alcohol dehydrogenase family)
MHRRGASVVVADAGLDMGGDHPDPAVAEQVAAGLGERVAAFSEDLTEQGAPARVVALAMARFGAVDMVVNNAAVLRDAFIFKSTPQNFERVLAVNLLAPMALLSAATPVMREQAKNGRAPGRIVNMVSTAGLFGNFGQAAYAASKAGLVGLTRVVAMDLARSAITCNAVAPFAATRVTESIQPANEAQAQYKQRALSVAAEDVARLVAVLCSDGARATGQIFGVRGREVFLFNQARPVRQAALSPDIHRRDAELRQLIDADWLTGYTDLATDLEYFNTEPVI